jgi:glycosyltransferase involved in cell wall biosynthesis
MPSRVESSGAGEGFGIVYVEAGARGLPVVAGNAAGALDAVIDGETGFLVDPERPEAIAEALVELLQDRERAKRMGRAGWERARLLSWDQATAGVETVLDEVMAR